MPSLFFVKHLTIILTTLLVGNILWKVNFMAIKVVPEKWYRHSKSDIVTSDGINNEDYQIYLIEKSQ